MTSEVKRARELVELYECVGARENEGTECMWRGENVGTRVSKGDEW